MFFLGKMYKFIIVFLLISQENCQEIICENTKNCICISNGFQYEFQCSPNLSDSDNNMLINYADKELSIECVNSTLDWNLFPAVFPATIYKLEILFCNFLDFAFVQSDSLKSIEVKHSNLKNLTFLQRYDSLENLIFQSCNISDLDDIFSHLPNLISLELSGNNIRLTVDLLLRNQELTYLDLSSNNLENIPDRFFKPLINLEILNLSDNELSCLDNDIFKGVQNLKALELRGNNIKEIASNSLGTLHNLIALSLSDNRLTDLPQNIFESNSKLELIELRGNLNLNLSILNLEHIKEIDLSKCNLETLPENLFKNSTLLSVLRMQQNLFKSLPDGFFESLINLKELYLQDNRLKSMNVLRTMIKLEKIDLSGNYLNNISGVFRHNKQLKSLNLAGNLLENSKEIIREFISIPLLEEVDLSWNLLNSFEAEDVFQLFNLKKLDLSHNRITSININYLNMLSNDLTINVESNLIEKVDFIHLESEETNFRILLVDNPIVCDCQNYNFLKYLQTSKEMITGNSTCHNFQEQLLNEVDLKLLTCFLEQSNNCSYFFRPVDTCLIVNCSGKNLTRFPQLNFPQTVHFDQTELILTDNLLTKGPDENTQGILNVTYLKMGQNRLENIDWLPPKLKHLELDGNRLGFLKSTILDKLNATNLKSVSLGNNPWICDCTVKKFTKFLQENSAKVDSKKIFCVNSTSLAVALHPTDVCFYWSLPKTFLTLSIIFLVFAINTALYYRYEEEVKVWLFAKNLCLWWITEEEIDKEKKYDAFISYSHKDEEFVTQHLQPVLESEPNPYKLCLHYRNFIPGESILQQIVHSVMDSRRTVVVLSPNFLESIWGKMEFRTAHTQAMSEGKVRVIVILYGEVDVKSLDPELQIYLKTNTYLKWGDPYFWNKLRFALPHCKFRQYDA